MKIFTSTSFRAVTDQVSRIEAGFVAHGHEITDSYESADLIYVNNSWYDEAIGAKKNGRLKAGAKIIFNVLDLCPQDPFYPVAKLKVQLLEADAVTTISQFVHDDLLAKTGIESSIIYQPVKPVLPRKEGECKKYPQYKYLFVGRVNDPCKRAWLGIEALKLAGAKASEIITVGFEPPRYGGDYAGPVSDKILRDLYQSVDFVVCPSKFEGLLLPAVESAAAGVIPVMCKDLVTLGELFPQCAFPEYHEIEPNPQSLANFILDLNGNPMKMDALKSRLHRHFDEEWSDRMSPMGVAGSILTVYQRI